MNVTFSLPEETVKRLREVARRTGESRKGAISEFVDAAIREHLREVESKLRHEEFWAVRGKDVLVAAGSLKELASALEKRAINPRDVTIMSSFPLEPSVKTGLRRHSD